MDGLRLRIISKGVSAGVAIKTPAIVDQFMRPTVGYGRKCYKAFFIRVVLSFFNSVKPLALNGI
jgi:hypothetical protein